MIQQLYPESETEALIEKYDSLGAKVSKFISYVEREWRVYIKAVDHCANREHTISYKFKSTQINN